MVMHGPSACPHPAKSPVWTNVYGPVRADAVACSMSLVEVSDFVNRWYTPLNDVEINTNLSPKKVCGYVLVVDGERIDVT